MMKPMLEICCGSFSDVKTAYENGADRVELNSALYMGGLTPTLANLIYAKEELEKISVNVETLQLWSERMLASGAIDEDAYNKRKL